MWNDILTKGFNYGLQNEDNRSIAGLQYLSKDNATAGCWLFKEICEDRA